jgi:hypothetical protein
MSKETERNFKEVIILQKNTVDRFNRIETDVKIGGFETDRIGKLKMKIWSRQNHSTIWWLTGKGSIIAVYEAGYREFGQTEKLALMNDVNSMSTINISLDSNVDNFFEEFRQLVNSHLHELTWSKEYPEFLESWRPVATLSLRNSAQDARFISNILSHKSLQAKRKH